MEIGLIPDVLLFLQDKGILRIINPVRTENGT